MKPGTMIVGVILMAFIMTAFAVILADGKAQYGLTSYNESDLETYQTLDELNDIAQEVQNSTEEDADRSLFDIFGGFLADAKDTGRITLKSFDTFDTMATKGMQQIGMPSFFSKTILTIFIVVAFLGLVGVVIGRSFFK